MGGGMIRVIVEGWLLGLSTGPYCFGACAPFLVPYLCAAGVSTWRGNMRIIGEFLVGRFLAYLLFGIAVGWVGGLLKPHLSQRVAATALVVTSALMMLYAIVNGLPHWRLCAWSARRLPVGRMPFVLGLLVGMNVCPPFLVAIARLLQLGGWVTGGLFFLGFFAGTTLFTLPLVSLSPFTGNIRAQRIGTYTAIIVGGWFLLSAWIGR